MFVFALILYAGMSMKLLSAQKPALQLLPDPQHIAFGADAIPVCKFSLSIRTAAINREDDLRSAHRIDHALSLLCGHKPPIRELLIGEDASSHEILLDDASIQAPLAGVRDVAGPASREAYKLIGTRDRIVIHASSSAGIDYGVTSLLQLLQPLDPSQPFVLSVAIDDWPALAYRGVMFDTVHGARPTVESMRQLLNEMEYWKLNELYFYAETNLPLTNPTPPWHGNGWSKEEIQDLVSYAAERHIQLIPCVELYGHLHDLLISELASSSGALVHGGELNPANPNSPALVNSWLRQMAEMFPSPWIHIGFDEPFELNHMDAASRGGAAPDRLWAEHLRKAADATVALGKKPMFWADIDQGAFLFNKYPQLIFELPQEAIAVPWFYDARTDYKPFLSAFNRYHVPLMVAPAVSDWDEIFPDYATSFVNIQGIATAGRDVGALGMINTIWSDSALALHRTAWPGIAFGAAAAWQNGAVLSNGFFLRYASLRTSPKLASIVSSAYQEMSTAETYIKNALGPEPVFRIFDMPFDSTYLARARTHREQLRQARLHLETAQSILGTSRIDGFSPEEYLSLRAEACSMDYSALRALYATEIEDNFSQLPSRPSQEEIEFRLGTETAARNHGRVTDLIDMSGECAGIYREAWLAQSLPYRLATAEGRWKREQEFWIGFQERIWRTQRTFTAGRPRPTLENVLRMHP
ncbi:MAG: family 20 glycosylhydrolase [Terracidiphilus sp.]|nr:family 20 glycosylhydrolase [Terracidiphilus sp.]